MNTGCSDVIKAALPHCTHSNNGVATGKQITNHWQNADHAPAHANKPSTVIFCSFCFNHLDYFPGHALHEKGLQRQIGDGTLVSSQERRAAVVPRINRVSTADFVPPSVYIGFALFALPKKSFKTLSSMPWRARGSVVSWANRPVGVPSYPAPPRPAAPPCAAPPRPLMACPGFGIDKYFRI